MTSEQDHELMKTVHQFPLVEQQKDNTIRISCMFSCIHKSIFCHNKRQIFEKGSFSIHPKSPSPFFLFFVQDDDDDDDDDPSSQATSPPLVSRRRHRSGPSAHPSSSHLPSSSSFLAMPASNLLLLFIFILLTINFFVLFHLATVLYLPANLSSHPVTIPNSGSSDVAELLRQQAALHHSEVKRWKHSTTLSAKIATEILALVDSFLADQLQEPLASSKVLALKDEDKRTLTPGTQPALASSGS